jgi:hypothetical protein
LLPEAGVALWQLAPHFLREKLTFALNQLNWSIPDALRNSLTFQHADIIESRHLFNLKPFTKRDLPSATRKNLTFDADIGQWQPVA